MAGFIGMMAAPMAVALVLTAMHGYLGGHVVRRGVIFVDIALAQVSACGVAVAMACGAEHGTNEAWLGGLAATFGGALLIAATRGGDRRIPQEAYIGIIYAVFSAAMILVLTRMPHGAEEINHLLVGSILWVSWAQVAKTAVLYAVLGAVLWLAHGRLALISDDPAAARARGLHLARWDILFYAVLGTVVTSSVQIAGVLLVFTLLVVPTVMAYRAGCRTERAHLAWVMATGVTAVGLGAGASYWLDLPTGAAIVCIFGFLLAVQAIVQGLAAGRTGRP